MKVNRIVILMGVVGLVYGTSSNAFYNVNASLTAPTTYNYSFVYNATYDLQELRNFNRTKAGWPGFVRTTDGAYYNYEWSSATGHFDDGNSGTPSNLPQDILPDGLEVQMLFNRSNTTWFAGTGANTGYYFADDTSIGSNNTVGTISNKVYLKWDNQTNKDYLLYFDQSSKGGFGYFTYKINNQVLFGDTVASGTIQMTNTNLNQWYVPSYSVVEIYVNAQGYGTGYDDGENAVIASGGLQGIITGVFDGIVAIFGIEIFNGITLGAIALFPLVITLFVFVMKIVKMGG
jgi:hypothetical protein